MSQESSQVVDTFKEQAEAPAESRDFESVTNKILELRQDNGAWQQNIADINDKVDMKTLGFPEDFRILDVQKDGKLLTVSEDGSKIQLRDARGLAVEEQRTSPPYNPQEGDFVSKNGVEGKPTDRIPFESAYKGSEEQAAPADQETVPAEPKTEVWGSKGREFKVNPDGTAEYVAKKGDSYWSVASDVAAQRLGRPVDVNNPEDLGNVNGVVNELAALNGKEIKDGKIALALDEPIKIPAATPTTESDADAGKTEWGSHGRNFNVNEDGSAEYTAKSGDNYWSVARDVVEKRLGHKVDSKNPADMTQVNEMTAELARLNGKTVVDGKISLSVGETIKIPPHDSQKAPTEAQPEEQKQEPPVEQQHEPPVEPRQEPPVEQREPPVEQRQEPPVEPRQEPPVEPRQEPPVEPRREPPAEPVSQAIGFEARSGRYNPVQPVGFEGNPGEEWTAPRASEGNQTVNWRRRFQEPTRSAEGNTTHTYIGAVEAGDQDNRFKAAEERAANGDLVARRVQYEHPQKMKFQLQPGRETEVSVKEVRTRVDSSGNYRTEIETADGTYLVAQTQANGQSRFLTAAEVRAQRGS